MSDCYGVWPFQDVFCLVDQFILPNEDTREHADGIELNISASINFAVAYRALSNLRHKPGTGYCKKQCNLGSSHQDRRRDLGLFLIKSSQDVTASSEEIITIQFIDRAFSGRLGKTGLDCGFNRVALITVR